MFARDISEVEVRAVLEDDDAIEARPDDQPYPSKLLLGWVVPAQVCDNCGEEFVDEATTAQLLRLANAAAQSGVQVEVRSFAA